MSYYVVLGIFIFCSFVEPEDSAVANTARKSKQN